MTTTTTTTPAAAAARELARKLIEHCLDNDWIEIGFESGGYHPELVVPFIAAALLSARQAQLEDDCKAVCRYCNGYGCLYLSAEYQFLPYASDKKMWIHPRANGSPFDAMPCDAAPIRAQAAETKAVSDTKG